MPSDRRLIWDGCFNVRDLGGLPAAGGRLTRPGAVVRADSLQQLTAAGWSALWEHGVRTVVDLRNDDELGADAARRPSALTTLHLPLDGIGDRTFWDLWQSGPQFGTPLYYAAHLERFPERSARVVRAIATAAPGGVAVHCTSGRDRAGQIALLLLVLAGVAPETIAADYALSSEGVRARCAARGEPDHEAEIEGYLAARATTAPAVVAELARTLDAPAVLGLADADVAAVRTRLAGPSTEA